MVYRILLLLMLGIMTGSCSREELYSENCPNCQLGFGLKVSILGDSYSTFRGFLYPESNPAYYPNEKTGVTDVSQTWWWRFIEEQGLELERNNSYSGSTIAKKNNSQGTSYVERYVQLGNPDLIFVFGATNDSWQKVPVGTYQYGDWQEEDLTYFRPAFAYLLWQLQKTYPQAKIVNLVNTDLQKTYKESMEMICRYYGVCCISLGDFEKKDGHPSEKGMASIYQQITKALAIE